MLYIMYNLLSVSYFGLFVIWNFLSCIYLKTQNNEIYEITVTIIDFDCVMYLLMIIYIIHSARFINSREDVTRGTLLQ